jgi:hypothetical protein
MNAFFKLITVDEDSYSREIFDMTEHNLPQRNE